MYLYRVRAVGYIGFENGKCYNGCKTSSCIVFQRGWNTPCAVWGNRALRAAQVCSIVALCDCRDRAFGFVHSSAAQVAMHLMVGALRHLGLVRAARGVLSSWF